MIFQYDPLPPFVQVMAAIETKLPGYYTSNLGETQSWDEPWDPGTQHPEFKHQTSKDTLWWTNIAMENHHFLWENSL